MYTFYVHINTSKTRCEKLIFQVQWNLTFAKEEKKNMLFIEKKNSQKTCTRNIYKMKLTDKMTWDYNFTTNQSTSGSGSCVVVAVVGKKMSFIVTVSNDCHSRQTISFSFSMS